MRSRLFLIVLAFALPFSASATKPDWVRIVATSPAPGAVLATGDSVRVTLEYQLTTADQAEIRLKGLMGHAVTSRDADQLPVTISRGSGKTEATLTYSEMGIANKLMAFMRLSPTEWHQGDKAITFVNGGDASILHGYVDDLAIYGRAIEASELLRLNRAAATHAPIPSTPPATPTAPAAVNQW